MSKRLKKVARYFLLGSLCLVVVAFSAHLIWKYSGSGQWELLGEKQGIKIYSLKSPGSTVKQFKGIVRVRSTLTAAMAASQDPDVCELLNCDEAKMFERLDERLQYYRVRMDYPFHFNPREFVIKQQFSRVPETKALLVEIIATPDKLPPNDCCVRVRNMHNTWRYTPLKNGELEIEYVMNASDDGFFPYVLANFGAPQYMHYILPKMQLILDKYQEKYPNAQFDLLAEK